MDWTDVHYRQLARLISKHTYLYTEMVVDSTLIHNPDTDKCGLSPSQCRPRRFGAQATHEAASSAPRAQVPVVPGGAAADRAAAGRQRPGQAGGGGAHRGALRLRRGQPQLRLPQRPRRGRRLLRRGAHAAPGGRRGGLRGDARRARRRHARHRQVPPGRRRRGQLRGAVQLCGRGVGGRRRAPLHHPRAQVPAQGPQPAPEPHGAAAAVRRRRRRSPACTTRRRACLKSEALLDVFAARHTVGQAWSGEVAVEAHGPRAAAAIRRPQWLGLSRDCQQPVRRPARRAAGPGPRVAPSARRARRAQARVGVGAQARLPAPGLQPERAGGGLPRGRGRARDARARGACARRAARARRAVHEAGAAAWAGRRSGGRAGGRAGARAGRRGQAAGGRDDRARRVLGALGGAGQRGRGRLGRARQRGRLPPPGAPALGPEQAAAAWSRARPGGRWSPRR